jgi:hypothetical protein
MTNPANDIIKDALDRFCGALTPEQRREIEMRLRAQWGGKSFYIKKQPAAGKVKRDDA